MFQSCLGVAGPDLPGTLLLVVKGGDYRAIASAPDGEAHWFRPRHIRYTDGEGNGMIYELTSLTGHALGAGALSERARGWMSDPAALGEVLGIWRTDIGIVGQLLILRGFEAEADLRKERDRALASADPFHCGGLATSLSMESYAGFPFLPPVAPGDYGGIFEFRTYHLKHGGLPVTMKAWEAAVGPAREYTDHLVTNMYALDGPPRITHIWGFSSLEERTRLRSEHFGNGLWPPKGGPDQIDHATSTIAIAEPGLPLS